MQHEPCGLLGDADIAGKLSAGDTLLVGRDQIDRHEPLVQADLGRLENGSDLDRKARPAIAAIRCCT